MLQLMIMLAGFAGEPKATAEDYQLFLAKFDQLADRLFDKKSWGTFQLIDKKTGERRPFSSLTSLETGTSVVMLAQQVSTEMARIQKGWENELDLYKDPDYKSNDPKVCKPPEIEGYIRRLVETRKKMAIKFEDYVLAYCAEFGKEVTGPELRLLSRKVKEFHDAYNLVPRKKE